MSEPLRGTLLRLAGRRRAATVLLLSGASALSEGAGLLLLVPLLAAVSGQAVSGDAPLARKMAVLAEQLGLGVLLILFVVLVALRGLLQVARAVSGARLERAVVSGLRARLVIGLLRADWKTLATLRQGEAMSLAVNGGDTAGFGVHELVNLSSAVMVLGTAFVAALALSPKVAVVALAGGLVVMLSYRIVRGRSHALGQQLAGNHVRLSSLLDEMLGALRVVKSYSAEGRTASQLAQVDARLTQARVDYAALGGSAQALLQLAGAMMLALLVWFAVAQWGVSAIVLMPLVALFARILPLVALVQGGWSSWLNARPLIERSLRLIDQLEAAAEPASPPCEVPAPRVSIALDRVTVRHLGRETPALDAVDVFLPVFSTTVLLGSSGAGKSTAADVIGGLIAPSEGGLLLDGRQLSPAERIAWRAQVAYVQQEPVLFNLTVRENLVWAMPTASEAHLERALTEASARFVLDLPLGLETPVGDAGRQFSGGERQRIVLARALLRDPALLILDEPTSALDADNELAIAEAVERMLGKLTVLIIGHRGPLTGLAERQVRLEAGRVVPG